MEAKKKTAWELLGQIALSKSKRVELLRFLGALACQGAEAEEVAAPAQPHPAPPKTTYPTR